MDLLGGTDLSKDLDIIKPLSQTIQPPITNSNNQDLLDLLGLDPLPLTSNDNIPITPSGKSMISNNLGLIMENNNSNLLPNVNNQNSNFFMDDLINTTANASDNVNGKLLHFSSFCF